MTPREAFFAPRERVPIERAVGRVSAELVAPYPPGIPALGPRRGRRRRARGRVCTARWQAGRAWQACPITTLATLFVVA